MQENDGNFNEFNIVDEMYNEADWYRSKADRLEKAAQMIESDDDSFFDGNDGGNNNRGRNSNSNNSRSSGRGGNRGSSNGRGRSGYNADEVIVGQGGRGNRSFSDSNNADDDRTMAGRQAHDADGYSDEDLEEFLNTARRNEDDSIDLRTEEGRALRAAGYIDDEGFPFDNHTGNSGNRGGSSRGRSSNSNRGRNSSGNSGRGRSNTNSNRGRSTGRSTSNR